MDTREWLLLLLSMPKFTLLCSNKKQILSYCHSRMLFLRLSFLNGDERLILMNQKFVEVSLGKVIVEGECTNSIKLSCGFS